MMQRLLSKNPDFTQAGDAVTTHLVGGGTGAGQTNTLTGATDLGLGGKWFISADETTSHGLTTPTGAASATVQTAGTDYTIGDVVQSTGGTGTEPTWTVTTIAKAALSAVVQTAGDNYTPGDVISVSGGGPGIAPTFHVATVTGGLTGPIATVTVATGGSLIYATNPLTVTGGTGAGAKLTVTFATTGPLAAVTVLSPGGLTAASNPVTLTGGTGTGGKLTVSYANGVQLPFQAAYDIATMTLPDASAAIGISLDPGVHGDNCLTIVNKSVDSVGAPVDIVQGSGSYLSVYGVLAGVPRALSGSQFTFDFYVGVQSGRAGHVNVAALLIDGINPPTVLWSENVYVSGGWNRITRTIECPVIPAASGLSLVPVISFDLVNSQDPDYGFEADPGDDTDDYADGAVVFGTMNKVALASFIVSAPDTLQSRVSVP